MNWFEKAIEVVSPRTALRREATRTAINEHRSYNGASHGRRTKGWKATGNSANAETLGSLNTLRNRSRELVRNNGYAKKAVRVLRNNIVGKGIRPAPYLSSKASDKIVKDLWWRWAETKKCDFYGRKTIYGLQRQIASAIFESGEVLVRIRRVTDNILPIQLQVLEPDFLDNTRDHQLINDGFIIQGVEFNNKGQRVAYWLFNQHPGEYITSQNIQSVRIPSDQILHIFREDRPGQVRGIPVAAPIMIRMKDLEDFEDAELLRQKIAACFTAFVINDPDVNASLPTSTPERIEAGRIEYLPQGKSIEFTNPPTKEGYDSYTKSQLRAVAAGFEVTYESLTNDLSNVNFSSGRMGWLEFQRTVDDWQEDVIIPLFLDPVWEMFILACKLTGKLKVDVAVRWTPPRREMIDPAKEITALIKARRAGFYTLSEIIRMLGLDPDDVFDELKNENETLDSNKLLLDSDPRADVQRIPKEPVKSVL
jgi:lambda family phage portal protein